MKRRADMRRAFWVGLGAAALVGSVAACKKASDGPAPSATPAPAPSPPPRKSGLSVRSEIGALDPDAAKKAVEAAMPSIRECVARPRKKMPYFGGDVETVLRIDASGKVAWAHFLRSELGDVEAEKCVLDALARQDWPKPEDADAGEARQSLELRASEDERPPTAWSESDLGDAGGKLVTALEGCRQKSGTAGLRATFYVDPRGAVMSVGVATEDEKGLAAVDCAVQAVRAQTFPTPGSYPAKVSVGVGR
ncbi:MAG: AgmX/PglI C-terminal domain-containing protein [Myxococcales bacterium]|nr:AgmX/PglI C-terminal domain-containing protein [Myxococcales bacterium]